MFDRLIIDSLQQFMECKNIPFGQGEYDKLFYKYINIFLDL